MGGGEAKKHCNRRSTIQVYNFQHLQGRLSHSCHRHRGRQDESLDINTREIANKLKGGGRWRTTGIIGANRREDDIEEDVGRWINTEDGRSGDGSGPNIQRIAILFRNERFVDLRVRRGGGEETERG